MILREIAILIFVLCFYVAMGVIWFMNTPCNPETQHCPEKPNEKSNEKSNENK